MKNLVGGLVVMLTLAACSTPNSSPAPAVTQQNEPTAQKTSGDDPADDFDRMCDVSVAQASENACVPGWAQAQKDQLTTAWKRWGIVPGQFGQGSLNSSNFQKRFGLSQEQIVCFKNNLCKGLPYESAN